MTTSHAPPSDAASAVVDLIGDLDATLAATFSETLQRLVGGGTTHVYVRARHLATTTSAGLAALDAACGLARACGAFVALDPGSRRMRAAFATVAPAVDRRRAPAHPPRARHLMIARHAASARVTRAPVLARSA